MAALRVVLLTEQPELLRLFGELFRRRGYQWQAVVTGRGQALLGDFVRLVPPEVGLVVPRHRDQLGGYLQGLGLDLLLCCGYSWRLGEEVLRLPRLGAINGHPSALPRYRGPNPIGWALLNGDRELSYTVHRMVPEFDAGPILAQTSFPVDEEEDYAELLPRLGEAALVSFQQALDRLEQGAPGDPQPLENVSVAPRFGPELGRLSWDRPARELHLQVRALCGEGAVGLLEGVAQRVIRTSLRVPPLSPGQPPPGTVLMREKTSLVVQCQDGPLRLLRWRAEARPPAQRQSSSTKTSG